MTILRHTSGAALRERSGTPICASRWDYPYISSIFGGTGGMVAATDMTYWVANERTMEGTKEPETIALCFSLESESLTDYGPMLVCRYYVMK